MAKSESNLSRRGEEAVRAGDSMDLTYDVMSDTWERIKNPTGYVNLGIAENTLMHPELIEHINRNFSLTPLHLTYGDGYVGSAQLREALARFLNRQFAPLQPVEAKHVIATLGCTTALEATAYALTDEGDGVLLGRPYYHNFINDCEKRALAKIVEVAFGDVDPFSVDAVAKYEDALLKARDEGTNVRVLLLCSPHNPLGQCYSKEVLQAYMRFCQNYRIHLVSDEIYALSVFHNTDIDQTGIFTSVLAIDTAGLIDPELVHVLWGMSKDFSANGLRIGCVVSQHNRVFLTAIRTNSIFHVPPSASDAITCSILNEDAFIDSYIRTNQSRMSVQHRYVTDFLRRYGIPYYKQTVAAFFIWVDLLTPYQRRLQQTGGHAKNVGTNGNTEKLKLEDREPASEHDTTALTQEIFNKMIEQKVFCGAGENYGAEGTGWFRIIFTQSAEVLDEGLGRMTKALGID